MGNIIEAQLIGSGLKVGIVVGRFNEFITSKLLGGALDGLKRHGVDENDVDIAWVPGAFELPLIAKKLVNTGKYEGMFSLILKNTGNITGFEFKTVIESDTGVQAVTEKVAM